MHFFDQRAEPFHQLAFLVEGQTLHQLVAFFQEIAHPPGFGRGGPFPYVRPQGFLKLFQGGKVLVEFPDDVNGNLGRADSRDDGRGDASPADVAVERAGVVAFRARKRL